MIEGLSGESGALLRALIGAGLGAIIGSFLATIVSRWPRGQSFVTGRSSCDSCSRSLAPVDLVPLLSWLIMRGKCRSCGARIDPVHPAVELAAALIGGVCAWVFAPVPALILALGAWLLLTLAVVDALHFRLPDVLTLPLIGLGLTVGEWVLPAPLPDRIVGALLGVFVMAAIAWIYKKLRGREGLGLGDAKLMGAIGAWMGWQALPFILFIASFSALLWLLLLRLAGRRFDAQTRVPLGTFLCLAVAPAWWLVLSLSA